MVACPYNARHLLPAKRTDKNLPNMVVDKCTFCFHRVKKGLVPACVQACVGGARIFGDMNDPNSEVAKLAAKERMTVLKPELGTSPAVSYIGSDWEIMDEPHSYTNRTTQLRREFNAYKRNHKGDTFSDIVEGESTMLQITEHFFGFMGSIPHKLSQVLKSFGTFIFG